VAFLQHSNYEVIEINNIVVAFLQQKKSTLWVDPPPQKHSVTHIYKKDPLKYVAKIKGLSSK